MPIDSVAAFVAAIRQHDLLEPAPLNEVLAESRRHSDPRAFAQTVVKKGWLTPFQANQVYAGTAASLSLGGYRIVERLGEGGMGTVYKARHVAMGRIVALKVIRKDRVENDRAIRRFQREIQIAARLSHPNIVLAHDAAAVNGMHFFVMEYVEGIDFTQLVKERGPLPVPQACEYIRQAASGLAYAHERGLVHRDIKPANLLVAKPRSQEPGSGSAAVVKILDLGLARLAWAEDEATGGPSLSQEGSVLGTPDYMAPEQAKNSRNVDGRADIYSLGCTLYFLLTGEVPFPGGTSVEKLVKHQLEEPCAVEKLRPDLPVPVRQVLAEMMAKRPEDRFQTAGEVAEALAPLSDSSAGGSPPPRRSRVRRSGVRSTGNSITQRLGQLLMPTSPKRRRLTAGVVAVGLLGIIGTLVAISLRAGSSGGPTATSQAKTSSPQPTNPAAVHAPLTRYLPDSTSFVWVFRAKDVLQSRAVEQHNASLKQAMFSWYSSLLLFEIDLYKDVDRAASVLSDPGREPTFFSVFQGSFDPKRFHEVVKKIVPRPSTHQVKGQPGSVYYQFPLIPGLRKQTCVAMLDAKTLIYSNDDKQVIESWQKGLGQRPAGLTDKDLQPLLDRLDDKPNIFLAVSGGFTLPGQQPLTQRGVRLLLFGFQVSEDVQAEYTLTARNADAFQSFKQGASPFFAEFFQFLGDPGVLTEGLRSTAPALDEAARTVRIKARHNPADMLKLFAPRRS